MAHKPETVLAELQKGKFRPVYFLHGEESYYIDAIDKYIEAHALPDSAKGFNQMVLYGKETDTVSILGQARRFPMMAERQVVIVRELQQMSDWNSKNGAQMMEAYLKNAVPTTVLVLCYKHKTFNKNTKLYKALDKQAIVVESKKLYDNQIPAWVKQYLKEKSFAIEEQACQLVSESIGANLGNLSHELDKMLINLQPKTQITAQHIEQYIGISKEFNIFEMQNALASQDQEKAAQILKYWEANPKKQPLILAVATLYTFFRRLLIGKANAGKNDQDLARAMQVSPFMLRNYRVAFKHYSSRRLMRAIEHLRYADLQSKGILAASGGESEIMKEMIFKILQDKD